MLTDDIKDSIQRSVLCWLATVDGEGRPNVSPKEIFATLDDERLVIADIASPGSVRNLQGHASACVSFIDVFVQKGYKLRGSARVATREEPCFQRLAEPLEAMTQGLFIIRSVIELRIESVEPIVAPSYRLKRGTTEAQQIESAMAAYGVRPCDQDGA